MTMTELNILDSRLGLRTAEIPRCAICGTPTFDLTPARFSAEWELCEECWQLYGEKP